MAIKSPTIKPEPGKLVNWKYIAIASIGVSIVLCIIAVTSLLNNPAATSFGPGPPAAESGGWLPSDEPGAPITNPPEKIVKQFLKEYPHIELYPTVLANFSRDYKQTWLSDAYPINDLPSEIRYTATGPSFPFYVVIEDFELGGRISGYVEYRGTIEQALLGFGPPAFGYISKYSTNPSGTSHVFIFPCKPMMIGVDDERTTYGDPGKTRRFKQETKWVDSSIYHNNNRGQHRFSPGEKLYFESIPKDQQDQQMEKLFHQPAVVDVDNYQTALKEQTQWVYIAWVG